MSVENVSVALGDHTLSIETGKLATQADGSVVVRMGDTVVLVCATMANEPRDKIFFLPLTCDYRENTYAAGKIPGGFFRREGRPNDKETLTSRLMDRPIRPIFPEGFGHETQVIAMVLSYDGQNDPAPLALCGSSAALNISRIPFDAVLAGVRVGLIDGEYVINPTSDQRAQSRLDLLMSASKDAIVMVEAGGEEVSETEVIDGLEFGHEACRKIIEAQEELVGKIKPTKFHYEPPTFDSKYTAEARKKVAKDLREAMGLKPKRASYARIDELKKELVASYPEDDVEARTECKKGFKAVLEEIFREEILENGKRSDGRAFDEIRDITCDAGYLPRTHGSAVFKRGETQSLVTVTLGTAHDAQRMDLIEGDVTKRFMLHYNFPPYSVGEVRFLRGPGRREIGHGNLAERALRPAMPSEDDFPYTVRIVSDILESNGSSSMASVCGGSLAMMDAGVPMKKPVAGIAMGLVSGDGQHAILSDIAGQEDHHGDMDFKVTGTADGITALQMDIKVKGLPREVLEKALEQAKEGRDHILEKMAEALETHREEVSQYAPRIFTIMVPRGKIGAIIGPGGKTIRSIVERTGAKIDVDDDGRVHIASVDEESAAMARKIVEDLTAEAEVGQTYLGRVVRIMDFGAFVEILPGVDGLVHVSELDEGHVRDVRDVVEEGDEILVKVLDIDDNERIRLSRRAALDTGEEGEGGDDERDEDDDDRPRRGRGRSRGRDRDDRDDDDRDDDDDDGDDDGGDDDDDRPRRRSSSGSGGRGRSRDGGGRGRDGGGRGRGRDGGGRGRDGGGRGRDGGGRGRDGGGRDGGGRGRGRDDDRGRGDRGRGRDRDDDRGRSRDRDDDRGRGRDRDDDRGRGRRDDDRGRGRDDDRGRGRDDDRGRGRDRDDDDRGRRRRR
ncbi:MAG: polyribonucleotide nucleotidyltransferase [Acidobacteriota bacterium]